MKTNIYQDILRRLLGFVLLAAGIGHLTFRRDEFQAQVPRWLTESDAIMDVIVVASGIVEILLGLATIFLARHKIRLGIILALFFVLIFPGNISQYTNGIDAFGLDTDRQRLIRLFFQPILIFWALWSSGAWQYFFSKSKNKE